MPEQVIAKIQERRFILFILSCQDFITVADKHNTSDNLTIQIDIQRISFDPEINSNGQKLIQLCKDNNLRIANGRCFGDSLGKGTFFSI